MINLDRKEYEAIMEQLKQINQNTKLSQVLRSDRDMVKSRYADMASLEAMARYEKVECALKYECSGCKVEKRNKCWSLTQKSLTRKKLIKGIPYVKEDLGAMRISYLWMLAGHLKVQTVGHTAGALVQLIFQAQKDYKPEVKEEPKRKEKKR